MLIHYFIATVLDTPTAIALLIKRKQSQPRQTSDLMLGIIMICLHDGSWPEYMYIYGDESKLFLQLAF